MGWTSINPSYDLGFTARYQGFDPSPYRSIRCCMVSFKIRLLGFHLSRPKTAGTDHRICDALPPLGSLGNTTARRCPCLPRLTCMPYRRRRLPMQFACLCSRVKRRCYKRRTYRSLGPRWSVSRHWWSSTPLRSLVVSLSRRRRMLA